MINSTIIQAINDGFQVVIPFAVKRELKIELSYYNELVTKTEQVKDKNKLIFLQWEDADESERKSWKKFLL
jgi:hypothetical protein